MERFELIQRITISKKNVNTNHNYKPRPSRVTIHQHVNRTKPLSADYNNDTSDSATCRHHRAALLACHNTQYVNRTKPLSADYNNDTSDSATCRHHRAALLACHNTPACEQNKAAISRLHNDTSDSATCRHHRAALLATKPLSADYINDSQIARPAAITAQHSSRVTIHQHQITTMTRLIARPAAITAQHSSRVTIHQHVNRTKPLSADYNNDTSDSATCRHRRAARATSIRHCLREWKSNAINNTKD
ncbi:hypothetical protein J6590_029600 [Homalodisca vitripennis]|nr:hypothetical protein J6590_029600 [Homalodisca vitripennis]